MEREKMCTCENCPAKEQGKEYFKNLFEKDRIDRNNAFREKQMNELKECCHNHDKMWNWDHKKFEFEPNKCRGYHGNCETCTCSKFRWWHAKCNCKIIREYDELHGVEND
jgi:hypothetical protein